MTWYVALTLLVSIPLALQFIREQRLFRRLGPVLVDCGRSPRLGAWHIFGAVLFTAFGLANTLFSGAGPIPVYPLPGQFLFIVIAASHWAALLSQVQIRSGGVATVSGGLPWEVFKSGHWSDATTVVFQTTSRCTFTLNVPATQADEVGAILERMLAIPFESSSARSCADASVSGRERVLSSGAAR